VDSISIPTAPTIHLPDGWRCGPCRESWARSRQLLQAAEEAVESESLKHKGMPIIPFQGLSISLHSASPLKFLILLFSIPTSPAEDEPFSRQCWTGPAYVCNDENTTLWEIRSHGGMSQTATTATVQHGDAREKETDRE
jgi:hypothetical protein